MPSVSSHSPSYPSGHTTQSEIFANVLSFRYPAHQDMLQKFADKCSKSRLILGVHFPSDAVFGKQLAAGIVRDENFKEKYFNAKTIGDSVETQENIPPPGPAPLSESEEVFGGHPTQTQNENTNTDMDDGSGVFGGLPKIPTGPPGPFPGR